MSTKDRIAKEFNSTYGCTPEVIARAPGRLEILGNHTDYNEGVALSCAADKSTFFAASKADGPTCRIYDAHYDKHIEFDIDSIGPAKPGAWSNYIKGIIVELRKRGHTPAPFNAVLCSEIPLSSGMSSSAALEISAAYAIGALCDIQLSPMEWAEIGQACENNYIGANTGLLDQLTSITGKKDCLVHIDFRTLETQLCPVPKGIAIVIANSSVKHDLTQDYNDRRAHCEAAARHLNKPSLRDVTGSELEAARESMDIMAYRRALHVVGENERVAEAVSALQQNSMRVFGQLWVESHHSSRDNFENSCPELDQLVEIGQSLPGFLGARLSGGGFGGISIHLVEAIEAENYRRRLATAFEIMTDKEPETMMCSIGEGAEIYV